MDKDPTYRAAMVGDEVKAGIQVDHTDNLVVVAALFSSTPANEEAPRGAPEIWLTWEQDENTFGERAKIGLYGPDNTRASTYELTGTIIRGTPPGVYRLRRLTFETAAGRIVRLDKDQLGISGEAYVLEILEERPENTHASGFAFIYDE